MYSKIVNPLNGEHVIINSILGKKILRDYLNVLIGGSEPTVGGKPMITSNIKTSVSEEPETLDLKTAVRLLKSYYHGRYN